mgnify:CR=1 FL=1
MDTEQPNVAVKFFLKAHVMAPNRTDIMDALAEIHLELGNVAEAHKHITKR